MTWWKSATAEQRLAQIDGGIECGIAARIIAKNVGADADELVTFAHQNGRKFGRPIEGLAKRRAYPRAAGPVFDTARRRKAPEPILDSYESAE